MQKFDANVTCVGIEEELKSSYLGYAMSVIVGRALPDVRDGLKPVHRRILYAMHAMGFVINKPHKKSARVVGDVMAKYHPHGDAAIYDAIVRMAQPFSLRHPLIDGQGNFGSIDGDAPAAQRYTEVRMSAIAQALLHDLEKDTVDFSPNYDGSEEIPDVLPARFPNLLVNGSTGIAVGMATNIPPHNLGEVIDATVAYLDDPTLTAEGLLPYLPGPDFPTGAIICGREGILDAYQTGRGRIVIRACVDITREPNERETIIVTELPYQVNKARLIEKIAELVKEKKVEGISGLRDESDREGMRIVIEVKRGVVAEVLLNQLFQHTALQTAFSVNAVVLSGGRPIVCQLTRLLSEFLAHRRTVVTRRTRYECQKAQERAHILEGLLVALLNLDHCIELIRASSQSAEAKKKLMQIVWTLDAAALSACNQASGSVSHQLTELQAQAILDLRLQKLTGLEQDKIQAEYQGLLETIAALQAILGNPDLLTDIVREELLQLKALSNPRRTVIEGALHMTHEDLVPKEAVVVTQSYKGYIKYQLLSDYEAQRRGGRGKLATAVKAEDFLENFLVANTHDTLLCFSTAGRLYWLKVYQLPQAGRGSRGRPIVNLLPLAQDERITTILACPQQPDTQSKYIFMATSQGIVKKTLLADMSRPRSTGVIAVNLTDGDRLIGAAFTSGEQEIMLFSAQGKVVRFAEMQVRAMGRHATGVRGMILGHGDRLMSLIVPEANGDILTVTENGYGKRTALTEYPVRSRGIQGVISIKVTARNGLVVGALQVQACDQMMLITNNATLVRIRVEEVSRIGRNTQGVTLIRTGPEDSVVRLQKLVDPDSDEGILLA